MAKKLVSDCHGKKVEIIKLKMGNEKKWTIPETWGYICSKCHNPCKIKEIEGKESG